MIELTNVTVTYFGEETPVLNDINLTIPEGQTVLVTGDSGCGKTTLLRCLNGLVPGFFDAHVTGSITLDGDPVATLPTRDVASRVGMVFQDPRSEFFTFDVTSELAFCCENFGLASEAIIRRVNEVAAETETVNLLGRRLLGLSGGEKQKVAIGAATMLSPKVLLFDEPSANIDLDGLEMLRGVMLRLKGQGVTMVVADHRLAYLTGVIDRCLVLKAGRIVADLTRDELDQLPDTWFTDHGLRRLKPRDLRLTATDPVAEPGLTIRDIEFAYPGQESLWRIAELALPASGVVGIIGANGAGKTTFMKVLLGLLRSRGQISWGGQRWPKRQRARDCALVMQDVEYQLVGESVWDEMLIGSPPGAHTEARAADLLARTGLDDLRERHPLTLSGGQKQRLGIALAAMKQARLICLDEPTSGLDAENMRRVSSLLTELGGADSLVLVITHDVEFIESTFDYTIHIDQRQVTLKRLARKDEQ
ncbi:MAG: ABC transporter ATP-binding protein [Propionibacteriaceae bacterium]|nr:ABC transporter ATP-binding protein [Propionibacteriaceae bacterium]